MSNNSKFRVAIGHVVLGISLLTVSSVVSAEMTNSNEETVVAGSDCRAMKASEESRLERSVTGIKNVGTSFTQVICPLPHMSTMGMKGMGEVQVYSKDTAMGAMSCTLTSIGWKGEVKGTTKTATNNTLDTSNNTNTYYNRIMGMGGVLSDQFSNYTVNCMMPGNATMIGMWYREN